jgi:hypothetical protein
LVNILNLLCRVCEIQDRVYVEMDDSVNGVRYVMVLQCRVASRKCLTCQYGQAHLGSIPVAYTEDCARAAVLGVLRSRRYVVVPYFYWAFIMLRIYAPEILETIFRTFYVYHPQGPLSKVILEKTKTQRVFIPKPSGSNTERPRGLTTPCLTVTSVMHISI